MNGRLRNTVTSAFLLLPAALVLSGAPVAALAQTAALQVRALEVSSDAGFEPGATLTFRLSGTPGVEAALRWRGMREGILLSEVAPGAYVGRYTLRRSDGLTPDTNIRATMSRGSRSAQADFELGEVFARRSDDRERGGRGAPAAAEPLRIERFGMLPVERLDPGTELHFELDGPPGARVAVDVAGVARDVQLREVRPGHYEGNYTIRRSDVFPAVRPVVATLRAGERVATLAIELALVRPGAPGRAEARPPGPDTRPVPGTRPPNVDNQAPTVVQLAPAEGARLPAGAPIQVSGGFDDGPGSGVDPASVRILLAGRDVTREAQVTRQGFNFRSALPPGHYTVDVAARDQAGNAVRRAWSFDVVAVSAILPVPTSIQVKVLTHHHEQQIGFGPATVQAQTLPNASITVNVLATLPNGERQELLARTLQADGNGSFNFTFQPPMTIPGTRYDIAMRASRGKDVDDGRLVLMQR